MKKKKKNVVVNGMTTHAAYPEATFRQLNFIPYTRTLYHIIYYYYKRELFFFVFYSSVLIFFFVKKKIVCIEINVAGKHNCFIMYILNIFFFICSCFGMDSLTFIRIVCIIIIGS